MNSASPTTADATLGGLISLADQIDAATQDVEQAWDIFRNGESPLKESALPVAPPVYGDRMNMANRVLHEAADRLLALARDMRARA